MSESKGISLRRKKTTAVRPTISAPKQIPAAAAAAAAVTPPRDRDRSQPPPPPLAPDAVRSNSTVSQDSASASRERPRPGGDQTSDLVKRRYSTRFTGGLPQDGPPPPMPAMPSLPPQFAAGAVGGSAAGGARTPVSRDGRSPERKGRLKVDMRALKDSNLSVDKYVQNILAEASESDILAYQKELQNVKAHTDSDLQHNVYQNRTQFIKISKEADKLKSEMRTLRTLMGELTGALGHATSAAGADLDSTSSLSAADRKRANRSSVANLEAMWSTHLQTLWKRVEGSQKYLPALPGRHIIMESQRWVELNAATWKPRRRIALVLLNDHLLVASEKKRPVDATPQGKGNRMSMHPAAGQSTTTLVADRCWPLHDVSLADISTRSSNAVGHVKENKNISNAINVRAGNESLTYATGDSTDKAGLIVAFRKAQEDQRKQAAAEHAQRERNLDEIAMLTGRDPRLLKKAAAAAAEKEADDTKLGGLSRSNSVLVDVDGRPQSIRWVESQIDGLDIDIALQHFEAAVARTEKLRNMARGIKGNATAQDIIQAKVNERASKLANSVARQLGQNSSGMDSTKEKVSWLLRLGFDELARNTYLHSRTETIRMRTRQLPFTGALEPYVHALAFTTFTLLLHTFRTFTQSFPSNSGSAVVRWAKERVDEFNGALERQLSSVERGSGIWTICVGTVKRQAIVLGEVGVDFSALAARGLDEPVYEPRPGSKSAKGSKEPVGLGVST